MKGRILIVEDRTDVRLSLKMILKAHQFDCWEAYDIASAQSICKKEQFDVAIIDLNYASDTTSGADGLMLLQWLQQHYSQMHVITMTAWSNVELAVECMRAGAADFITKPWSNRELLLKLEDLLVKGKGGGGISEASDISWLGDDHVVKELLRKAEKIAATDSSILLSGENGTGKTSLAKYIHSLSLRKDKPFVSVNVAAIPDDLFESELFGHKKGAFTGALSNRKGRFEVASQGTLFLDEIGSLPLNQQAKLLRVLESGEFESVGESMTQVSKARIIAATNANLPELIKQGKFREDLYYRLRTMELCMPPLRGRGETILTIAEHYLALFSKRYQKQSVNFSECAKSLLCAFHWPGNIRELNNCIESAVILADTDQQIMANVLGIRVNQSQLSEHSLASIEKQAILDTIKTCQGDVNKVAEELGISKSTLYRRFKQYDIKTSC